MGGRNRPNPRASQPRQNPKSTAWRGRHSKTAGDRWLVSVPRRAMAVRAEPAVLREPKRQSVDLIRQRFIIALTPSEPKRAEGAARAARGNPLEPAYRIAPNPQGSWNTQGAARAVRGNPLEPAFRLAPNPRALWNTLSAGLGKLRATSMSTRRSIASARGAAWSTVLFLGKANGARTSSANAG